MAEERKVVVSALQFACSDSISENVDTAERLVRAAHEKGANIVLIQELFEGYYFCQAQREDFIQRAKPYKGHPTILRMQNLAKELGVVIPVSFFEESNNAHYNSVAIIDADGTDLGVYRKSHIPDGPGYQEKFYFNPGDTGFKVFTTRFAKIGVAICWDQWFPEAARAMALQGAEILFYPTAIGSEPQDGGLDSREHWKRVMQGHAGANLVPLVAANRVGKETIKTEHGDSGITFYGNSFIAGPTGDIVALASDKDEDILTAEFDLNKIKTQRHSWGVFRDRRPDLYKMDSRGTFDTNLSSVDLDDQAGQLSRGSAQSPPISGQTESTIRRSSRGGNFAIEEDTLLVLAWLNTSLDAMRGFERKGTAFWSRVHEYYHKHKTFPSIRNENSLMHRWSTIQIATHKFCGCYAQVEARQQSDCTEYNKIGQAKLLYMEIHKHSFHFEHCWNELRNKPKWLEDCRKRNPRKSRSDAHAASTPTSETRATILETQAASTPILETQAASTSLEIHTSSAPIVATQAASTSLETHTVSTPPDSVGLGENDIDRSPPRKDEKDQIGKRKSNDYGKDDMDSPIVTLPSETKEKKQKTNKRKIKMYEKTYLQEKERLTIEKEKLAIEQEKLRAERSREEERIILMDTSAMSPLQAEYYRRRQMEIIKRGHVT